MTNVIEKLNVDIDSLKESLDAANKEIQELKGDIEMLEDSGCSTLKESLNEANQEIEELKGDIELMQDSDCYSCELKMHDIHDLEKTITTHEKYGDLPKLESLGDENKFHQVMRLYPHLSQIFLDATEATFKQIGYML